MEAMKKDPTKTTVAAVMAMCDPQAEAQGMVVVTNHEKVAEVTDCLALACHSASLRAGWWVGKDGADIRHNPLTFGNKLLLTHSELSEAMEGDRKSLADDKLPMYPMRIVELADAAIRIFDLAGAYILESDKFTFGEVLAAKMAFNESRADHKPEARAAAGGKSY